MKKQGRPPKFSREEIIKRTVEIFWERGYTATGLQQLLKDADLNKGSLYHFFENKRELFIACIEALESSSLRSLEQTLELSETPLEVIKSIFYGIADDSYAAHCKGCILGNTIVEFANNDPEVADIAKKYLFQMEKLFQIYLAKAQERGQWTPDGNPEWTAKYLINLWNGLNITRRLYDSKEQLIQLIDMNLQILKSS
ncbi:TetR/AcrR family transcriptional regulator [Halosquirtibacter xylanolyticus]|uniref:TetR/AcrR family transcriptional regulator n=1 Tax=Halosquirtibacter xylanolyticus TaxID=3374599 RepID=UPI003748DE0A|nr:TetR/AcrR family transcriptional regulator [Prolixibacteraceae bacterium]